MRRVVGIGAGGHCKVLIDIIKLRGQLAIVGLTDSSPRLWGTTVSGVPVLGGDEILLNLFTSGVTAMFVGVGGTRDNSARRSLYEAARQSGFESTDLIHPHATMASDVVVGSGLMMMAGAIVNSGVVFGDNVIVNTGAIIEHDCQIDSHVHVATGARVAGAVTIQEGAHIGAGATLKQGIRVGPGAVVGAGAVVTRDVAAGTTVIGIPARPLVRPPHSTR